MRPTFFFRVEVNKQTKQFYDVVPFPSVIPLFGYFSAIRLFLRYSSVIPLSSLFNTPHMKKTTLHRLFAAFGCLFLFAANAAAQQAGTLDASFGTGGVVTLPFSNITSAGRGIALQSDGKIVVVGNTGATNILICRYNTNGSLDNTFGTNGIVNPTSALHKNNALRSVKVLSDGKILVAGRFVDSFDYPVVTCSSFDVDRTIFDIGRNTLDTLEAGRTTTIDHPRPFHDHRPLSTVPRPSTTPDRS